MRKARRQCRRGLEGSGYTTSPSTRVYGCRIATHVLSACLQRRGQNGQVRCSLGDKPTPPYYVIVCGPVRMPPHRGF
jgi:hypothetical protein